jgi:tRNA (guanine-N7-)-methyltransferase
MINEEDSPALSIEGDFNFSSEKFSLEKMLTLHGVTERFEGGFIHFERVYTMQDAVMLRLSMGSFDRPEHLYIIVKEQGASYYPALPLKSKSNLNAHNFLDGVLHG